MQLRSRRIAAALVALGLAAACSSETGETETGIAESDVGGSAASESAAGGSDGSEAEAGGEYDDASDPSDPSDPGGATSGTTGSGTNFKLVEAQTISELNEPKDLGGNADEMAAAIGEPNDGNIEDVFGADRWTLEAEAGTLLAIDILDIDHGCSQDLDLILESPSGARGNAGWVGNGGCEAHGPFLFEETGQHVIEFAGGDGATIEENTGKYRFIPVFLTEVDEAELVFDQPNDGEISELFGVDRWTFTGTAGDLLTIDILDIDHKCSQDLTMVIEDPIGERTKVGWVGNGGCEAHGPIELEQDGPHVIELYGGDGATIDENTGTYRMVPSWLTQREEAAASPEARIDGEISQVFGSQRWTFDAPAGAVLTVEVLDIDHDCHQDLTLRIEDPFGEEVDSLWVGNGGCEAHGPFELDRDGTYVIEFAGGDGATIADNIGAYAFTFDL